VLLPELRSVWFVDLTTLVIKSALLLDHIDEWVKLNVSRSQLKLKRGTGFARQNLYVKRTYMNPFPNDILPSNITY
jgi:hypothetical protein